MAICVMAVVAVAPCQCFSPGENQITSPGRISSIGPPQRCARPQPAVTINVWPSGWLCQAVRAPGSNVTLAPRTRAGSGASNRGSMRTAPVKYSAGPFPEGCEPLLLMSIFSIPPRCLQKRNTPPQPGKMPGCGGHIHCLPRSMGLDKAQHLLPGVSRCLSKISRPAIKEAVRRFRIDDDLVFNPGLIQLLIELLHIAHRNALIGSAKEAKRRISHFLGALQNGALAAKAPRHPGVKADNPGKAKSLVHARRVGERSAHAEAHCERSRARLIMLAQIGLGCMNISSKALDLHLLDMRHVFKGIIPAAQAGSAPEVVNCNCGNTHLGKAQGQFFVELVQPAHIGIDNHLSSA